MNLADLQQANCQSLSGSEYALAKPRIEEALRILPAWQLVESTNAAELVREFRFPDYHRTMAFVNALAFIAHQQDHHPDLSVHFNRVQVRFSTHDVGGISINDLICAAKVSALIDR